MLYTTAYLILQFFDEYFHELCIVDDVTALEHPLGQSVHVLLNGKARLAEMAQDIIALIDHFGRSQRVQEVVYGHLV